jgi:peptide/nickel transport system substrate-binding protein
MNRNHRLIGILFLVGILLLTATSASAEKPLVIAYRGDAATLDPHGRLETTTLGIQANVFDRLVKMDQELNIVPDLAVSWKILDNTTWEFKLRTDVRFHNGETFDAEAAKYSLIRAKTHDKSQFKAMVPNYDKIEAVDARTLRIYTKEPEPETPLMLTYVQMVPPKYYSEHDDAHLAANPVGSGAYRFEEWVKDDHIKMVRNDDWHHGTADFETLLIRPIPEDATRVAALISGEIDACWGVPIPDIPRVEKNSGTYVSRAPSQRVIYLMFDVYTDKGGPAPEMQPGLPDGAPNPFKDIRVRKAIAHAVNVDEIIQYVMEGSAYPATQIISSYASGFNPEIERPQYDPKLAEKLLEEAGFPDGFKANFDTPNDRYINDQQVAEAIAGQLRKIGLDLSVVAQPKAVFFPKMNRHESPMFLVGWGLLSWQGTMNTFFREKEGAYGRNNRGRFKDEGIEKAIDIASSIMDKEKRVAMQHRVMAQAMDTYYMLPLYYQENVNGYSKRVKGFARVDEFMYAYEIKKAK